MKKNKIHNIKLLQNIAHVNLLKNLNIQSRNKQKLIPKKNIQKI